ncbi:MAG: hypothetical protein EOO08_06910 [Chitinophagaceae bacterium]|nr:MAG: hypothetical protein EOO08_06910 [Chitinophagaceae bacterium]
MEELQLLFANSPEQRAEMDTLAAQLREQVPVLLKYNISELVESGDSKRLITLFTMHQRIRTAIAREQNLLLQRQE